jgi:uncharacterized protein (TIGR04255 family)
MSKTKRPRTDSTLARDVSKPLKHPPLSEVAFEVNFHNLFAVETGIAEYQRRVESVYPTSVGEYVVRLPPSVAFGKPTRQENTSLKPLRSFVFQNPTAARTIRVSVVNFTLLVTDYLHFEDYKRSLIAALSPAIEIFQLQRVERMGLRYVNLIPIPKEQAEVRYRERVRSPIGASAFSRRVPSSFLAEVSIDLDDAKKLTIRSGLLPPQDHALPTRNYLLDLDCYSFGDVPLTTAGLPKLLDEYHGAIEAEFMRAVTDEYWKDMEGAASR